jgi:predicted metal-dependent peptidase
VLVHEFYHLVFEHVTGRLPDELAGVMGKKQPTAEEQKLFRLWNIAADLAINYHIGAENLPDGCCIPGGPMFEDVPGDMTSEYYFELLKKKQKEKEQEQESQEQGQGDDSDVSPGDSDDGSGEGAPQSFDMDDAGQFDSHDDWNENETSSQPEAAADIARERLKEALKKATAEAASKGWGNISASCRKDILERLTSKVDWRKVLRYFVKTSQRAEKRSTPKRLNRRYAYVHPGRKVKRTASIAVSIDQSGSVSDSMLAAFYAELEKLSDIATFTVIPFDSEVVEDAVYEWKKGQSHPKKRYTCGGTDFNPPTDYVNVQKFDGHIVLTDMCAPKPKRSNCQRMWMTTEYYAKHPYFSTTERIIAINEAS